MVYIHYSKACGKDTKLQNFRSRKGLSFYKLKLREKKISAPRDAWGQGEPERALSQDPTDSMLTPWPRVTSQFPTIPLWVRLKKRESGWFSAGECHHPGFQWTGPCQARWSSLAQSVWLSIFTNDRKEVCLSNLPITTPERHGNMLNYRIRIQKDCGDLDQQNQ